MGIIYFKDDNVIFKINVNHVIDMVEKCSRLKIKTLAVAWTRFVFLLNFRVMSFIFEMRSKNYAMGILNSGIVCNFTAWNL